MPTVSERGQNMPASPIRRLVPYSEAAKERGIKVYHLNIGQPDIKTPTIAIEAVIKSNIEIVEYSHSAGFLSYRKKLANYYQRNDIYIDYKDILITTGGSEAIIFTFLTALNQGDEIIVPEPFYANYLGFAYQAGVKIVALSSSINTGFSLPSINEFEKAITPKTKGILICNPNNPTGYLYSLNEMNRLRDLVLKHDLYLFSDEVYREFCYDGEKHISALHLEGIEKNVVMFDSVSKRYSECGLRIGCMITRNEAIISNALKYGQARLSPPTFGQIAAEASLDVPESYYEEVNKEYTARRNFLVDGLNKIPGVFSPMPRGSFYTMATLPVDNSDKFCAWILSDFNYHGETVMMAPGEGFYCTPGLGRQEVRIAYVLKVEDLAKALIILEKALQAYPGKTN